MSAPAPSPDALREGWLRLCRRLFWADDFGAAMADPVRRRMVEIEARHPTRVVRCFPVGACPRAIQPAATTAPGFFDRKRAAAGDFDS